MLLIIYALLTGAQPSVVRSTIMALVFLFGYILEREVDIYNSLALAAIVILTYNPWQLFEIGFQLSFLSVFFIVWLSPKIKTLFPLKILKIKWLNFLIVVFSVSCAAWLGTLGMVLYYFKTFSPITVFANMIIVPLVSMITALGFAIAISGILFPNLASIFAASADLLIWSLIKANSNLIKLPAAYFSLPYQVSPFFILVYYILIISIFNLPFLLRRVYPIISKINLRPFSSY